MEYRIGKKWNEKEDNTLIKEYNEEEKNIIEISQLHNRLPNGIAMRLLSLNVITDKNDARGYDGYKESEYYKTYLKSEKRKSNVDNKKKNNTDNILKTQNENTTKNENKCYNKTELSYEIIMIRKEMKEIKQDILELKEMITSIYEFENSEN